MTRAYQDGDKGAKCPRCDSIYPEDDWETDVDVLYNPEILGDHDGSGDTHCSYLYVRPGTGSPEKAYFCPDGDLVHDQGPAPDFVEVWKCGICESWYTDKDEAVECCT